MGLFDLRLFASAFLALIELVYVFRIITSNHDRMPTAVGCAVLVVVALVCTVASMVFYNKHTARSWIFFGAGAALYAISWALVEKVLHLHTF